MDKIRVTTMIVLFELPTIYHYANVFNTRQWGTNLQDGIRITPTFSYVGKGGGGPIPVDLYYQTNEQPFMKIGSAEDKVSRYVILNDRMRNIPLKPLIDAVTTQRANASVQK